MTIINTSRMRPVSELRTGMSEVVLDLVELATEASQYVLSHKWCAGIKSLYFDRGFPKVAVFLANIEPALGADPQVWVIVGDVSPLYIDTEDCENRAEALAGYILAYYELLSRYRQREILVDVPPILTRESLLPIELNDEVARILRSRLRFIRDMIEELWNDEIRYNIKDLDEENVTRYM
jgi:hypothetical protein